MSLNNSSSILTFERSSIPLMSEAKPDADGYYEINAGAYGVFNESGTLYSSEDIDKLFESTALLQRRFDKGVVFSELGHPVLSPNMTTTMQTARLSQIAEDRYCGHIKKARLINSADKKFKITRINVKPFGHYKSTLHDGLTSKHANCFFSVRSFSHLRRVNGIPTKFVKEIVTWDFVTEGGIRMANKFDTNLDLESMRYDEISPLVSTEELHSIDLNNTNEIKYILNHIDEYRASHNDLESNDVFRTVSDILVKATIADKEDLIFDWK